MKVTSGLFTLCGALIGGLISWLLQSRRAKVDQGIAIQAIKTEFMAEQTALHFLNHKGYTDRSFDLLSKRLGGFEGNELRKILVRAGAVRYIRVDGSKWWRLLSRSQEAYRNTETEGLGVGNEDL
jgi:hypothetical protein